MDGSYFDRNVIENKFAQIEGHIANVLQEVDSNLSNRQTLSLDEEVAFALFIALQLVRLPMVREIINNSPKGQFTSDVDKEIYDKATYRMMLLSRESGFEYLKENGLVLSEDAKEQLKGQSLLEYTASFILSKCVIYVLTAPNDDPYVLSDMPVTALKEFLLMRSIIVVRSRISIFLTLCQKLGITLFLAAQIFLVSTSPLILKRYQKECLMAVSP